MKKNVKKHEKMNTKLHKQNHFSAELFSDTRLRQGPPAGVLTYVEDWTAAVQRRSREKKPLKSPRGETIIVRSFGSWQGVSLHPSEVVQVVRRAMDDWLTTPPGSKRTTKTSLLPGEPSFLLPLICKSKPNYEHLDVNITVCNKKVYNDFSLKIYQKSKPNPNPIQTQFQKPVKNVAKEAKVAQNICVVNRQTKS